jgi:hypothetical protein
MDLRRGKSVVCSEPVWCARSVLTISDRETDASVVACAQNVNNTSTGWGGLSLRAQHKPDVPWLRLLLMLWESGVYGGLSVVFLGDLFVV